jgi:Protein of unknown function (DUF1616)
MNPITRQLPPALARPLASAPGAVAASLAVLLLPVLLLVPNPVRALLVLPIVLVAPGYALLLAVGRDLATEDRIRAACLAVGLSIAVVPMLVLLAYVIRRPLETGTVLAAIVIGTLAFAAVSVLVHRDDGRPTLAAGPRGWIVGSAAVGIVAIGLLVLVARLALPGGTAARFSAIALDGRWAQTSTVTVLAPGKTLAVDVRVDNESGRTQHYDVVPDVKGVRWAGASFDLPSGESWRGKVSGTIPAGGCLRRLQISLRCQPRLCQQGVTLWLADRAQLPASCSA